MVVIRGMTQMALRFLLANNEAVYFDGRREVNILMPHCLNKKPPSGTQKLLPEFEWTLETSSRIACVSSQD